MAPESAIPVGRKFAFPQELRRPPLRILTSLWALTKPGINLLIAITVLFCFCLVDRITWDFPFFRLLNTLMGTLLVSSGAAALNQFIERQFDGLMRRTARRPVVLGDVPPRAALIFGMLVSALGIAWLAVRVNPLASFIAGSGLIIYLAAYTPLKRVTPLCTLVGAIAGATPPLIGWAAASGSLDAGAWTLYTILFLWQFPHFMAIAWMYREDYDRAGYMTLPRCKRRFQFAALLAVIPALLLIPCGMIPWSIGIAGGIYLTGSLALGGGFACYALRLAVRRSNAAARELLFASIVYLPLLQLLMLLDKR